jgi:DNA-directed RNA polymerase sigma subunit (sigma70/sigma32)
MVDLIRRPPTCTYSIDYQLTSDGNDLFLCDVLTDGLPDDVSIDQVVEAMELLPVVQRQILRAIYLDLESPSRRQLAERLGIDRNRITDLERQAIRTLQHLLTSPPDSPRDSQPVQRRRHRRTIDRQAIEHRAAQPC